MLKRFVILIVSGLLTATTFASVAACSEALAGDDNRDGVTLVEGLEPN